MNYQALIIQFLPHFERNLCWKQLKVKFDDIYQFWLGSTRIIIVNGLEDVQHIFANRHVYDQGDIFAEKFGLVNPNEIIALKGVKYKRHASIVGPLFRGYKINLHLDTAIDCTDNLLDRWRTYNNDPTQVHLNMIEQCRQLALAIFGYIAFDYDLQTLDDENHSNENELCCALHTFHNTAVDLMQLPTVIGRIYLLLNQKYRRSQAIINQYLQRMIDQELAENPTTRAERKRTCLIASLVTSLQQDEMLEATKSEEDRKGT
ncbi:unnamed protein product [Rotaria sordida]|uniref:Uncharacterized protein n=1 Tax=Rotaria sordida TaxID=392033 RepID=A0A819RJ20_9BILA|nr:unnamed protein product [Rotaria sordida]